MSLKTNRHGASQKNGLTPGGKTNRSMTNLGKKAINKKSTQYTDSGQNYRDANNKLVKGTNVDEGELSPVIRKSPERPYVKVGKGSEFSGEKLYLGGNPRYDNYKTGYTNRNKKKTK